ncbi:MULTISPECIES: helix-turn-helix domain-containing protein [Flammeovirga]|uniref:Helix-turn-helix transcriptional regulator n=1 Tax=Flammeovirga agarivorans TaxID=2726742 RepID=A0A7X8SG22_9BACT|nr:MULTISPECIES: AraC family transcriptional regulator [Flammeovirga]NLR89595.1 helix-turn-helix transcriptional regulator [Flammeovirga agarivorans]
MLIEIKNRKTWIEEIAEFLEVPLEEDSKKIVVDNDLVNGTFEVIEIEKGLFVRYSDFTLKKELYFKELGASEKQDMILDFTFQGYPDGTIITEYPDNTVSDEKHILIYSGNSTIVARFPINRHSTFISILMSYEWLNKNFTDFFNKYPNIDVGLETDRVFLKKMKYGYAFEFTLEQLMSRSYSEELRSPVYKGVVLMIVAEVMMRIHDDKKNKFLFDSDTQYELDNLESYIKLNLDSDITIDQLCKKIGYSKTKLHNMFKSYFNYSVYDYIKQLRLSKAKSLLLTTDLNVSEVANKVGYTSVPHFTNLFKKEVGLTPNQYRKGDDRNINS